MDDFEKELKLGFLEEALQSIEDVEQTFLLIETEPNNKEHINKIFRLAHNLKGSSKAVGFDQFGEFTHEFETFVLKIKNEELLINDAVVSFLLKLTDFIKGMCDDLRLNLDAHFNVSELMHEMKSFSPLSLVINEDKAEEALLEAQGLECMAREAVVIEPIPLKTQPKAAPLLSGVITQAAADESIRVSVSKIESLLNMVGEMVILQSVLTQNIEKNNTEKTKKTSQQLNKITKEIQDVSMALRMVPVKTTFQKMQRIVRDTAKTLNKDVLLVLTGEDTELDKSVLENINDPLVHLVRNSVDHGIESADKRLKAGKSAQGKVELKAYHRSGRLVIEVIDDGGGLNAEMLKSIAVSKGVINESAILTETECFKLIFAPGFSTKVEVSEVSGRGVGMDVVRTNIEKLGGDIQIESALGKGTTIKITLPLTMAIIDGLVATSNNLKYIIPLVQIHETLNPQAHQIYKEKNLGTMLLLRGENIPLYYLGDFFNEKQTQPESNMIAVVFKSGAQFFAILVDDIINQQQVVVKQLTQDMQGTKGISGTTILGDGMPSLILEPCDLLLRTIKKSNPLKIENKEIAA